MICIKRRQSINMNIPMYLCDNLDKIFASSDPLYSMGFKMARLLLTISINLLAFYHNCWNLIGYAIRYLFLDR